MSSFGLYLIGFLFVAIGVGYGAFIIGIPPIWIAIALVILFGFVIMGGVRKTREPDDTAASD